MTKVRSATIKKQGYVTKISKSKNLSKPLHLKIIMTNNRTAITTHQTVD